MSGYLDTLHALREFQLETTGRADAAIEARLIEAGHIINPLYEFNDDAEETGA
ncbi:hypothetical protein [Lysobacter sp. CA199]|uniref:hypothetical protein n=1 Tax=Lysobacter sp. CA199 TaxID=3455608 RepID=UPI003F8D7DCD